MVLEAVVERILASTRGEIEIVDDLPDYWQNLGLKQDPFENNNQTTVYFSWSERARQLAKLNEFIKWDASLLLLTAKLGCGKSSLIKEFSKDITIAFGTMKSRVDFGVIQLVGFLAANFNLPASAKTTSAQVQLSVQSQLLQQSENKSLIIVEDAHVLPTVTLTALVRMSLTQSITHKRIKILLTGEPQLWDRVDLLVKAIDSDIKIDNLSLAPLTIDESKRYLNHVLTAVGGSIKLLSASMLKHVFELSGGVPGRINRVAQQVLVDLAKNPIKQIKQEPPVDEKPQDAVVTKRNPNIKILSLALIALAVAIFIILQNNNYFAINTNIAGTAPAIVTTIKAPPQIVTTIKPTPKVVAPKPKFTAAEQKLLNLTSGFTVQLLGVRNQGALVDFIKKNNLSKSANIFRGTYLAKNWYTLIYGDYKTHAAAKAAINKLPQAIKKLHPWVRSIKSVQQAILKRA